MNRKIVFFDIDGTLVGASRKVTEKNQEAVKKIRENGHLAILCTGRAPVSIDQSILNIGFDGIVASAGGLIKINNEYVFENFINQYLLSEVMLLFTNHQVLFSLETKEAIYQSPGIMNFFETLNKIRFKDNLELTRAFEDRAKNDHRKALKEFDINQTPVMKICFIAPKKEDFEKCRSFLNEFFNIVTFSDDKEKYVNGEIILKHCTKGDGVEFVSNYYNIPIEDTFGYGDSMNDYEMLQVTGVSVVSELSADNLKALADGIFEEPDHDGIYKSLKSYGLI